jgi:DNA-binding GntR family transcriptional regulator
MIEAKGGRAAAQPPPQKIDRSADQPVYNQLAALLHQQILDGRFNPGEKLPSEMKLVDAYGVSPMTVRRAINLLAAQDVITTIRGKGSFVKAVSIEDAAFYLRDMKSFFSADQDTTVKVIAARFVPADERMARKLKTQPGSKVIYIRRLIYVGEKPVFYHRGYLVSDPTRPVVEAELEVTELRGVFQGSGNQLIKSGDIYLEATTLDDEEISLLQLAQWTPGMMLEHIFYDFNDQPLSWGWFVCSNEHLKLQTRVGLEPINGLRDERPR